MSPSIEESDRCANDRIKQVFQFLKALNEQRNPMVRNVREQPSPSDPWALWLDDLPVDASVEFSRRNLQANTTDNEVDVEDASLLRVRRPKTTPSPIPPQELQGWVKSGWENDPRIEIEIVDAQNARTPQDDTIVVRFQDDPIRVSALEQWKVVRDEWRKAEKPARDAMDLFNNLYGLHGRLERDAERYDLVIGDGILSWAQPLGSIYHPTVLQRVQLVFDPTIPEFTVQDADSRGELFDGPIALVDGVNLTDVRKQFEAGGYENAGINRFEVENERVLQ